MWQSEMPWYGCPMKGKPYRYSMDFKGKGKGKFAKDLASKGKKKSSETDWVQSTNRIKTKDQLSKLLLRAAADSSGSCFASFEKKKPSDKMKQKTNQMKDKKEKRENKKKNKKDTSDTESIASTPRATTTSLKVRRISGLTADGKMLVSFWRVLFLAHLKVSEVLR